VSWRPWLEDRALRQMQGLPSEAAGRRPAGVRIRRMGSIALVVRPSRRPEELPKSSGHAPQSKEEGELPFWTAQNFPGTVSWRTPISG